MRPQKEVVQMKKLLLLMAAAAMVAVSAGFAQVSSHLTRRPHVRAACVIRVKDLGNRVVATAHCKYGKKNVPVRLTHNLLVHDGSGNSCGASVTAKGGVVVIPSGANSVTYNFVAKSAKKVGGRYLLKRVTGRTAPGGDDYMCGQLGKTALPDPSVICSWNAQRAVPEDHCGIPNEWASFSSPLSMSSNTVSVGQVATRSGNCHLTNSDVGSARAAGSGNWMGYPYDRQLLACSDGVWVWINIIQVVFENQSGQVCANYRHMLGGAWSFQVPPEWGPGTMHVTTSLGVGYDWRKADPRPLVRETTSASFSLNPNGMVDPCSAMG